MKKNIVIFIIGIILFGIGCGYIAFEVIDYSIEQLPHSEYIEPKEYEKNYEINGTNYSFHNNSGNIKIVIDESEPNIRVNVKYDGKIVNIKENKIIQEKYPEQHTVYYSFNYISFKNYHKKIINSVKNSIKNKVFYDYDEVFHPDITITVNSENKKYVSNEY